jgi:hypothetical protein
VVDLSRGPLLRSSDHVPIDVQRGRRRGVPKQCGDGPDIAGSRERLGGAVVPTRVQRDAFALDAEPSRGAANLLETASRSSRPQLVGKDQPAVLILLLIAALCGTASSRRGATRARGNGCAALPGHAWVTLALRSDDGSNLSDFEVRPARGICFWAPYRRTDRDAREGVADVVITTLRGAYVSTDDGSKWQRLDDRS